MDNESNSDPSFAFQIVNKRGTKMLNTSKYFFTFFFPITFTLSLCTIKKYLMIAVKHECEMEKFRHRYITNHAIGQTHWTISDENEWMKFVMLITEITRGHKINWEIMKFWVMFFKRLSSFLRKDNTLIVMYDPIQTRVIIITRKMVAVIGSGTG